MRSSLATLIDDWRASGSQTAIVEYVGNRRRATSYSELLHRAEQFAAEIHRRGISTGDRIVLWGHNSAEWVAVFFACILRGVIAVPLDAAGSLEFAQRVIEETKPRLITGDAELLKQLTSSAPILGHEALFSQLPSSDPHLSMDSVNLTRETPLQIIFTSGTTSEPKGVVHTHGNVLASLEPIEREMAKYRRYEKPFHPLRFLHTLPLSHVFGQFMGLWLPPLLAAEVHFESRLEAERLIRIMHRERISLLIAVPRMLELLRAHLLSSEEQLPRQLTLARGTPIWKRFWRFRRIHGRFGWKFWAFICGGAALPADLEQFWSTLGYAVIQGYGMTETTALITLNHPFKLSQGSIGTVLPGREISISPDGEVSVRGEMVASSTWQHGTIQPRNDPWLATGDLVSRGPQGQLRFIGRKSEVIVTPAGLNIHPEDLEAALMHQPEIAACVVVPVDQQPVAVLLAPSGHDAAQKAVAAANQKLAAYQRIGKWHLWPDADLPRTSTGKIQRRKVADWAVDQNRTITTSNNGSRVDDPLLTLIVSITGIPVSRAEEDARLAEDLHLDSLGRLQLQSAIEHHYGIALDDEAFLSVETLGQLRTAITRNAEPPSSSEPHPEATRSTPTDERPISAIEPPQSEFLYPRWPWWRPVVALRILFLELVLRPLVWILLRPRLELPSAADLPSKPTLLIANHATVLDVPLILYALPPRIRHRIAIASAGEMLEDWRHGRSQPHWWQNILAPPQYLLLTALFNIFPLPRQAGFRRSVAHIGEALDHGYHVLIFPEGRRSSDGSLLPFRSGIGVLAQESSVPVLPVAIKGLDTLIPRKRRWFHAGIPSLHAAAPIRLDPSERPEDAARTLHEIMRKLLQ